MGYYDLHGIILQGALEYILPDCCEGQQLYMSVGSRL